VRTRLGQQVDEVAFQGRVVATPTATRATDRLLGTITETSLAFLGLALVLVALARRRPRLAGAVVVALGGSVVTTEVLKRWVFTRPQMAGISGIPGNSYPSGHATIGMSLALGFVVVIAHHWRWLASIAAAVVATAFGTAVLTSGWHRPSDTFAAYLVCLAWYCVTMAVLVAWRGQGDLDELGRDTVEEAADVRMTALAGGLLLALLVIALARSVQTDGLRTVQYSGWYVLVCILIDVAGVAVVAVFHLLMRDVSPDSPRRSHAASALSS
jgi:membrane-associated phospholipid phosphatase